MTPRGQVVQTIVTAAGMASALGDMATACAAIRAGLSRPAEIPHQQVVDFDAHEAVPVIGHPAGCATEGFAAPARWMILAQAALEDLASRAKFPPAKDSAFWDRTGLFVVTPVLNDARLFELPACRAETIWDSCIGAATKEAGLFLKQANFQVISFGSAGAAYAVGLATESLQRGALSQVILLAVDSLLDGHSLECLAEYQRLKCEANPVGLAPGEAACALLLESPPGAHKRGIHPLATVAHSAFDPDGPHFLEPSARSNPALVSVLRQALGARGDVGQFEGDLIVDLNGEEWRAAAFGAALAAVPSDLLGNARVFPPAVCLGDTGAASAAIGMAMSLRAFARGYSRRAESLVLALSDYGEAGALLLRKEA